MPIRVLPDDVASKIAAGEVVERPASVVKELIENSLDAQAGAVSVRIVQAGKLLIEVFDDGEGIPAEELELAVTRHATSKLAAPEDLTRIRTLGFRGEALASIAAVSRLSLASRPRDARSGARVLVEGGKLVSREVVGMDFGTEVRAEQLFYNVPARMKFLKQDVTERMQVVSLVQRYALAYPDVRFRLVAEEKPVLQTGASGDRREALAALLGPDVAAQMLEVSFHDEGLAVEGFISPVGLTRANRKDMTFFVNGRWVQNSSLASALLQAYHTYLMVGRYPLAVLFVALAPEAVDVNVHPTKSEVRFRDAQTVFSGVQRAVRRALLAYGGAAGVAVPELSWGKTREVPPAGFSSWDALGPAPREESRAPDQAQEESPADLGLRLPLLRPIGQVGATYLVAEGPDGLYLIDQHAAHERVLFEKLLDQMEDAVPTQALLEPVVVELPAHEAMLLESQLALLRGMGFEIEPFGVGSYRVRSVPQLFADGNVEAALRVVVGDFEEDESALQNLREARIAARVCKRMAVKAGQVLSTEEQRALIESLERCRSPRTCPHGRPTMIHLSAALLERQFGRQGSR